MRYLVAVLALALGAAGMVAGEADDSPGLQLLGAVLIVGSVALVVRTLRRHRREHPRSQRAAPDA